MVSRSRVVALGLIGLACDDAPGVPDNLEQACQQLVECYEPESGLATGQQIDECRETLTAQYDDAATYGCAGPYADLVSCYALVPLVCSMRGSGSCEVAESRFTRCQAEAGQDDCVVIGSIGSAEGCVINCGLFSASCMPPATPGGEVSCTCDAGDRTGTRYTSTDCETNVELPARVACQ